MLPFQKRLRPGRVGLLHADDPGSGGPSSATGVEGGARVADLHPAESQGLAENAGSPRIALLRRNHERERVGARARPHADLIEPAQQLAAALRSLAQARFHGRQLIADDVAEAPDAARPRLGIIPAPPRRVVTEGVAQELPWRDGDRRCQSGAGRFAEDAQAAVISLVVPRGTPHIVERVDHHAGPAGARQVRRHAAADRVAFGHDQRIDIRIDGIEPRREEHARRGGLILVEIIDHLRMPDVVQPGNNQLRLLLRQHVPVAVVVMAGVLVVQLRRERALPGRAQRALIPVGDDVHAIGVQRRNQDQHRIREDRARRGIIGGCHTVSEQNGAVGGSGLVGVNGAGDHYDDAALIDQRLRHGGRRGARIGKPALDLAVMRQRPEVLGGADQGGNERAALGSAAEFLDAHAGAGRGKTLEPLHHRLPVQQTSVGIEWVAEPGRWLRNRLRRRGPCGHDHRYGDGSFTESSNLGASHAHPAAVEQALSLHRPRRTAHDAPRPSHNSFVFNIKNSPTAHYAPSVP